MKQDGLGVSDAAKAVAHWQSMRQVNDAGLMPSRPTFLAMLSGLLLCGCQGQITKNSGGLEYGILIQRYSGRDLLKRDADHAFPAASISKLLVAIAFLERDTFSHAVDTANVEVRPAAFAAVNRFFPSARSGSHLSSRLLLTQMIEQSDDFSANVLIETLGLPRINSVAKRLNLDVLRVHGLFYDTSAPLVPRGYTTARDCNKMLRYILFSARSTSSRSADYERLLKTMTRQSDRRFVPSAVPPGTQVANKTGEIHDELNDAAIITPFASDPVLFTILAHGRFNVFTNPDTYRRAVLAVQGYTRSTYTSLHLPR